MSHALESSPRAAYLGKPAWHGLGVVVGERMPLAQFLETARMSYVPELRPTFYGAADGAAVSIPGQYAIVRSDDGRVLSPHTVSKRYSVVSPAMLAEPIATWVDQGFASWDAAFTLYDGHSEVITARLDDISVPVDGDDSVTEWFLVGQNFHGTSKVRFKVAGNRVVCSNTVAVAFAGGSDLAFSHTASVAERITSATTAWESARDEPGR